jgi:hypothetical protein
MPNANKPAAPIAPAQTDVAALTEQLAALANVVQTLAVASLAPRPTRAARKSVSAAALSPVETFCAQAGFRAGSERNKLFSDLFARGSGDYPLADFPYAKTSDAHVVSRRIAPDRKNLPFSLAIDGEERGAARLIFRDLRKPVESTEGEKSE